MFGRIYGYVKEKCVGSKKAIFSFICVRKSRAECSMRETIGDWRWGVAIYSVGGGVLFTLVTLTLLKGKWGSPSNEQTEPEKVTGELN